MKGIEEKTVADAKASTEASVTANIWGGMYVNDSFIAATIYYDGEESHRNALLGLKKSDEHHDVQAIE